MKRQNPLEKLMHGYCEIHKQLLDNKIPYQKAKELNGYQEEEEFKAYKSAMGKLSMKGNVLLKNPHFAELWIYTMRKIKMISYLTNPISLRNKKLRDKTELELISGISALENINFLKEDLEHLALQD
ncbi:hypothetical protein J4226_00865 [Candidatus Pacearchaeota archaeon]|nr:hypothetical protein [Candidatus Pacearchaeota archaeon]